MLRTEYYSVAQQCQWNVPIKQKQCQVNLSQKYMGRAGGGGHKDLFCTLFKVFPIQPWRMTVPDKIQINLVW